MATAQFNLFEAIDRAAARRNVGVERSAHRAEKRSPGWAAAALAQLEIYIGARVTLANQGRDEHLLDFLTEHFVAWSRGRIPAPPDDRAFGSVMQMAARRGWIMRNGYALAASSNMSPKVRWRAQVLR